MSNAAEILVESPKLELVRSRPQLNNLITLEASPSVPEHRSTAREVFILAVILAFLQIADGVLTGIGVHYLGIDMEANPLLRVLMLNLGTISTLILVKSCAIGIIAFLTTFAHAVTWLVYAMRGMALLYACAAIVPWTAILIGYFS